MLFLATAWGYTRGLAMGAAADALVDATDRLFSADETAGRTAARLGRVVRRELDALNAGLDGAFTRLRALENVLENQIAALDEAGARVDVRGESGRRQLTQERERIQGVAGSASRCGVARLRNCGRACRAAQIHYRDGGDGAQDQPARSLDTQAADFRPPPSPGRRAPHAAALELDAQAKRIEAFPTPRWQRAEFVLGRQEKQRGAMDEMMGRLKEEGAVAGNALGVRSGHGECGRRTFSPKPATRKRHRRRPNVIWNF